MTDDNAKEWVTIKIESTVRDEAKADSRTYTDIMRAGLTGDSGRSSDVDVDVDEIAEEVADELKNELSMANDPAVQLDTADIIGRIEDLEAALPRKVAEELGAGR